MLPPNAVDRVHFVVPIDWRIASHLNLFSIDTTLPIEEWRPRALVCVSVHSNNNNERHYHVHRLLKQLWEYPHLKKLCEEHRVFARMGSLVGVESGDESVVGICGDYTVSRVSVDALRSALHLQDDDEHTEEGGNSSKDTISPLSSSYPSLQLWGRLDDVKNVFLAVTSTSSVSSSLCKNTTMHIQQTMDFIATSIHDLPALFPLPSIDE